MIIHTGISTQSYHPFLLYDYCRQKTLHTYDGGHVTRQYCDPNIVTGVFRHCVRSISVITVSDISHTNGVTSVQVMPSVKIKSASLSVTLMIRVNFGKPSCLISSSSLFIDHVSRKKHCAPFIRCQHRCYSYKFKMSA